MSGLALPLDRAGAGERARRKRRYALTSRAPGKFEIASHAA